MEIESSNLMAEIQQRIIVLLGLEDVDARLVLALQTTYNLLLMATSETGNDCLSKLASNPNAMLRLLNMLPIEMVYLRQRNATRSIRYDVAEMRRFCVEKPGIYEVEMDSFLKALVPCAQGLKASLFVIGYDGTYLEYVEAGHSGEPVVGYAEMMNTKAMERLPEPMRGIVISHHDRAILTGEPQSYEYLSPVSGRLMRSLAVPYKEMELIALFVFEAREALVPA